MLYDLRVKFWMPHHAVKCRYVPQDIASIPNDNVRALQLDCKVFPRWHGTAAGLQGFSLGSQLPKVLSGIRFCFAGKPLSLCASQNVLT